MPCSDVLAFLQYHLEQMIRSRAANVGGFVPTMSCALTRLLRDACGGSSRTAVVVTLSPRPADSKITMHSLQFALSVSRVHNRSQFVPPHAHPSIMKQFGLTEAAAVADNDTETLYTSPLAHHVTDVSMHGLMVAPCSPRMPPTVRRWSRIRA